jgi:hypothetical protein
MGQSESYAGHCFCGAVGFTLSGAPEVMAYCHCDSCRHWSGGQVAAFTLWKPDAFKVTKGVDHIGAFDKLAATNNGAGTSNRKWCKCCGGHIYTDHPTMGVVDVPAVLVVGLDFRPEFHVHYQETVHQMKDGLPKFRDLPAEAGGSGDMLSE